MTIPVGALERSARDPDLGALAFPRTRGGGRIVLYTSSDCWRGAGISFVHIARGLARHGFEPHVIAMCPEVIREFANADIPVTAVPRGDREARTLRRLLAALDADAVLVDRAHDLRVATLAVMGTRVALVSRYNHFRPKPPTDLLVRVAHHTVLRDLVFLSTTARNRVLGEWSFMRRVPSTTIYEGIDADEFRPCPNLATAFRARYGLNGEPFLLAVGALAPEKRYSFLFESIARLGSRAPDVIVCGEGPEEQRLRQRASELSIRVRFLGRIPRCDLPGAYGAALGLVHVGAVETFGLAVLEAMACARPIIASAGGALPELLGDSDECGTLVPVDAVSGVTDAIRWLIDNPSEAACRGARARERARTRFSVQAMEDAYARLVARHVPAARGGSPTTAR